MEDANGQMPRTSVETHRFGRSEKPLTGEEPARGGSSETGELFRRERYFRKIARGRDVLTQKVSSMR